MSEEKDLLELSFEQLKANLGSIIDNSIPVWRRKKSGELVLIPPDRIDRFITGEKLDYSVFYISREWQSMIVSDKSPVRPLSHRGETQHADTESQPDPYFDYRVKVASLGHEEREEYYRSIVDSLQVYDTDRNVINEKEIGGIIDAVSEAFVLSKTSFEDFYNDSDNVTIEHIKRIAKNTTALVQGTLSILKKSRAANNFINLLGEKSTGSTLDHMYSVFMTYLPFCNFYNSYFARGKISRIRAEYKTRYFKYYSRFRLQHPPETLEDVFCGGMREITPEQLLQAGIGAFLHDIGKVDNIDYFEGGEKFDRKVIIKHAPLSYNMIVKTREFESEVSILAALHHEYYNDETGYGIAKLLFPEAARKFKVPHHCLSYNLSDLKSGLSIAYVPAKMLEIVDVFDALLDKQRKYRKSEFTVDEALGIMKNEFIVKKTKIDPILFSVFLDFIGQNAQMKDGSLPEVLALK